ncbi:acetyl-CoA carboxylase biotin carboxyl carrier protein subunit [Aurantiacibacter xanthus]|jgi:acetyl-CoA carboxylase biotin carboxyl carrier protein|uniref:Biotin carboxyl carrier protein of acetyl-CoA carboxylase n=1 Tax=Aurantiacibacter xanthus TaxID=1784712 RepID=A0A3A1P4X1_9SPHN|nr:MULTISPECIES: biotin/lipoyl-containing protein [Sphingomonadales]RIV84854.1 acetyl-CoA carboxylase biotin carboxyl carrier protein subunit [Aurantiacibacter xanthus]
MSTEPILTPEDVADIVAILDGTSYERIDITTSRFTLRVARSGDGWTQDWSWKQDEDAQAASAGPIEPLSSGSATGVPDDGTVAVRSPLPGVFYRSPQPGAAPFVDVGDTVAPDTVVGIIETMKLMNPVHAGIAGTVASWSVDNAEQVDKDGVILRVTPVPA